MSNFFIRRPIVAMVIAIITVIVGIVSMLGLPVAQFPNIVPPQIQVQTTYVGADALTVEASVATPIEQEMSGVEGMEYMYSINANNGMMTLNTIFGVSTIPTTDQILAQMRQTQASPQLPSDVRNYGVTVEQALSSPLGVFVLYSPNGTYDPTFLANYAYININDPMTRVNGVGSVTIFGAGEYAMRIWVKPDRLATLNITVPEVIRAVQTQNNVNPAGQIGAEPVPKGQVFTFTVNTTGRLVTEDDFKNIVIRANKDGSIVKVGDVARVELGAQVYNLKGRFNGQNAAIIAVYQLPGSNAVDTMKAARALMEQSSKLFPSDLKYAVALDTTLAVTEGMKEIVKTLFEAMVLVIIVVFIFLQGWRATLIPLIAVPVSLIGTFAVFPMLGFSINTLSLFGLVLAIGLVVDDAIVVVEAIESHIEEGLSPRDAAIKAMSQVQGPVVAIALILAAVFIPTVFIPGITGQMYQQFAVTMAVSVLISAFNALTLSPALGALLLRPKKESHGLLSKFFGGFNKFFGVATNGYVSVCHGLIRKLVISLILIVGIGLLGGGIASKMPSGFIPEEDQGYLFGVVQLPRASSLQQTSEAATDIENILMKTPGVESVTTIVGFNLLSTVQSTYTGFFFITLKPWAERTTPELQVDAIQQHINREVAALPKPSAAFAFPPPAIPGIGTSGGVTFILEDRTGGPVELIAKNTQTFMEAARKRPELASLFTTALWDVPQIYLGVDQAQAMVQGVSLSDAYQTVQTFFGGYFVNYFNRFGLQWQVYVQAEGDYRTDISNLGLFYVTNKDGQAVPVSSFVTPKKTYGPEFTMRYNMYRCSQISASVAPGYSTGQAMKALEEVFAQTMPQGAGYDYFGMSYQEQQAAQGVPPAAIFGLSLLFVFLILAAQYESWSLPFSVLLTTPIAVFGAFAGLAARGMQNNLYAQIGLVMLIGLAAKNAILIVEFAKDEYEKGKPLFEATLAGAKLRLRPILMTAFAFILGTVPLAIATGSGAVSRRILGTTVIGGMLAATLISIFLIPASFYFVEKFFVGKKSEDEGGETAPKAPEAPGASA
ncbi:hydrophobic/amphiphilic exporter-1, HAE1 family [Terrimicrobium sacchariphilum]|uniref:Hydrophobic/amphiphilic exporter-1, HAE1 family n=1 Tax=Terrimicrobium sacchariphilum TaxID=690879 RepID=A0A146G6L3_TERSA|nr:multidrug efflux RND transporter permease subunit [Terrimicrobium sacchariphilum]GAT33161.1 hydrophobic/amphiphilic exporter-1, HAE1 family [Terrimicrobium sacchariphilum]